VQRQHNLENVSVAIPRDELVVITDVSGSGKSTLAFDTLYAEGQRRTSVAHKYLSTKNGFPLVIFAMLTRLRASPRHRGATLFP
jgi:ABC-type methionine transport system ATPase subunit